MTDENLSGVAPAEDVSLFPVRTDAVEQDIEGAESSTAEVVDEAEVEDEGEAKPKARGLQKRFNELSAKVRESEERAQKEERRRNQLEDQNAELLRRVLQGNEAPKPEPVAQPESEPKLEQFETYEQFVTALADHRADLKFQAWEQKQQQAEVARQRQAQQQTFQQKIETFRQAHDDFDAVALNPALAVTETMVEIISGSGDGPALLYQLGQYPAEAARIAALPPAQAAFELGVFAFKASLPQPKLTSSAPPPVEPLSGGSGSLSVDPDKMSTSEWVRWRNQSLKR